MALAKAEKLTVEDNGKTVTVKITSFLSKRTRLRCTRSIFVSKEDLPELIKKLTEIND